MHIITYIIQDILRILQSCELRGGCLMGGGGSSLNIKDSFAPEFNPCHVYTSNV